MVDGFANGSLVTRANHKRKKSKSECVHDKTVRQAGNSRVGVALLETAKEKTFKGQEVFIDYGDKYSTSA